MRKVVLKLTTQKDLIQHDSEASTFGELKSEMRQVKWDGMRVVERSTKATLQMDDAVLPQGDFVLFLVPEKVKSGKKVSGGADKLSGPIEDCKYNELRSHISWLNRNKDANLDMSGGTDDLKLQLMEYYDGKKTPKAAPKAEAKKPAAPKAEKPAKVAQYKPTPREDDEDDEDYEDRIAFEKKAFDKKRKKAAEKAEELRLAAEKAAEEKAAAEKKAADQKNAEKKPKKEKKGLFGKKKKAEDEGPTDPVEKIEDARERINKAVDEIVKNSLEAGAPVPSILEFTAAGLEKEAKAIHSKLRTSRNRAKYID